MGQMYICTECSKVYNFQQNLHSLISPRTAKHIECLKFKDCRLLLPIKYNNVQKRGILAKYKREE